MKFIASNCSSLALILLLVGALIVQSEEPINAQAPSSAKPNIVFLYADDFAYWAISALGNEIIKTPNLDRLVARGVNFSNAFNMGGWNGAICIA
ncbi:MAG: sulfatase-like hydrolase/transferase, partial [Gammaproteobacteria bacterium]|nr:sulfatase-like hydrolase/transferase [Gammaproteobacteria bacterium]